MSYLTETDERPEGYGFTGGGGQSGIRAIDYKTGQIKWGHDTQAERRVCSQQPGICFSVTTAREIYRVRPGERKDPLAYRAAVECD